MDERSKAMTLYRVDYWHASRKAWVNYGEATTQEVAEIVYQKALAWHYAGIVRMVKVTEEVLKQSKEPSHD
jgi:hypothetical protein